MTQRDFKIKNGLIFGGNVTSNTNGFIFDYVANTLTLAGELVALQSAVDLVQDNVNAIASGSTAGTDLVQDNLNIFASNAIANTNTVSSNVDSLEIRLVANINTVSGNVDSLTTSVNTIKANVDSVQGNVTTAISTAAANDFATYTILTANINTVSGNVDSLTTSVNTIKANVDSVQGNVTTAISTAAANDFATYTILTANINTVSGNVDSLTTSVNTIKANVDSVQSNVANIINGTTPFTGTVTMQQDLLVSGNLVVSGATTAIDSTDTHIKDRVITLSNGATAATFDTGLLLARGSDGNVFVGFDESADEFVAGYTSDGGSNSVTDFTISAYANVHFNNIVVEGTVDGVDVAALKTGVDGIQANINSVQSNVGTLTTSVNTIKGNVDSVASNVASVISNTNTVQSNVTSLTNSVNTIKANVDSVSSNVANIINGTTEFTGAVTFQDNISADRIILNTQLQVGSNVTTGVGASSTPVFTFPGAIYRGAELLMMVQDITNSEYQLSKILVVHNGNDVFTTEYGIIYTGVGDLTSFIASIDGSDVITVSSVGGSANKKITVASHYLIQ